MKLFKLLFCLLFSTFLSAQEFATDLHFTKLDQKIPRAVSNIFEDSKGFLWFGSSGGLCRYDGTEIKLFKAHSIDTNSLSSSLIQFITEDQNGRLWIGTRGRGLNAYNQETDVFEHYLHDSTNKETISSNIMQRLAADEEGKIWIGFSDKDDLNCFDPLTKKSQRFLVQRGEKGQLQGKVSGDIIAESDRIYLSTTAGFEYYDKKNKRFHFIPLLDEKGDTIYYSLSALHKSKDGKFWMAMPDKGLRVYNPKTNQSKTYDVFTEKGAQNPKIDVIQEGNDGRLWLYCQGELWSLSPNQKKLQQHQVFLDFDKVDGSTSDAFLIDRYGLFWLQSNYYDPRRSLIKYYQIKSKKNDNPLFIHGIEVMNDSIIRVATDENDFIQKLNTNQYLPFTLDSFILKPVKNIDFHPQEVEWAVFHQQKPVLLVNKETQETYFFKLEKGGKPFDFYIMRLIFDNRKTIWISTWGQGLLRIKYEDWKNSNGIITQFDQWLPNDNSPSIPTDKLLWAMADSKNNIWISGSVGGVTVINQEDESIKQYDFKQGINSISDTYTFATVEDNNGNIWIATNNGGLNKYDPDTEEITVFNRENGLINEELFRIYSDADGDLWLNTAVGLSHLDTETKQFTHYNQNDGVLAWRTNGSLLKKTGLLAWGGNEGFIIANVDSIKNRPTYPSDILLTGINIFDSKEKENEEMQPIAWKSNEFKLSHQQNTLTLKFSVLDFRNRVKHRYQYSLTQSNSPDWIDLEDRNEVSLNQLAPGTYYFHLRGQNSDLLWSELEQPLKIMIRPPFWRTTWAYLLYVLLISGGIYYFYRFNLSRQLARQEATQLQTMNQLKSRFYTNITHEFRTPLTVILGIAKEEKDFNKARNLIVRNGQKLLQLVNQLLDLSKIDTGYLSANYQQIEIVSFTQYIGESFQSLAERKYIRLTIYCEIKELYLDMDEEKYRQIISNLLSNAIKFTPESGKLILHLSQQGEQLFIKVTDNGVGIAEEQLPYVFDRFYQVENTQSKQGEGTGIGLALVKELVQLMDGTIRVESKVNVGTTFHLQFPIRRTSLRRLEAYEVIDTDHSTTDGIDSLSTQRDTDLPRLLIVEDNTDVVIYIQALLSSHYDLLIASNGEEGIHKAIEHTPDIIISDVMMPKKNGFEVVETLKQDMRTSHIPIILLTAKATQEDKIEGLKYGADAYLMKPFDKEELLIRLKNLIEVRQKLQAKYVDFKPQIQQTNSLEEKFLKEVYDLIEANCTNFDFSVDTLAQALNMSHTQLYRKLKALTNQSASQLIRLQRLEKAKQLLANKALNISEIAYELGYSDPNYFIRQFTQQFKQSPNTYRKSLNIK